jgi:hypothetical protein
MLHAAAKLGGGFRGDAAKAPVKMGETLESDIICDLCDAGSRLHQHALGFFHAGSVHEVREREARGTLEELAEVKGTHIHSTGYSFEGHGLSKVLMDERLCVAHGLRLVRRGGKQKTMGTFTEL